MKYLLLLKLFLDATVSAAMISNITSDPAVLREPDSSPRMDYPVPTNARYRPDAGTLEEQDSFALPSIPSSILRNLQTMNSHGVLNREFSWFGASMQTTTAANVDDDIYDYDGDYGEYHSEGHHHSLEAKKASMGHRVENWNVTVGGVSVASTGFLFENVSDSIEGFPVNVARKLSLLDSTLALTCAMMLFAIHEQSIKLCAE